MKIELVAPVSKVGYDYLGDKTEITVERPFGFVGESQLVYGVLEIVNLPMHMTYEMRIGTPLRITVEVIDGTDPTTKS